MWETWNTCNKSKLLAQRNQKHIQTGEYLLPVCPEYFCLPIGQKTWIYVQNCIFARYFCIGVKVSHNYVRTQTDGVQEQGNGEDIWI